MNENRLRIAHGLTAVLLAAAVLAVWAYVDLINPAPFYTIKYDPEMPYLMNSLAIFTSHPYTYIDHPGTPVELLGTLILGILKLSVRLPSDEFVPWVLAHPEVFLRWGHSVIALASAMTMAMVVLLARPVRQRFDLVWAMGAALVFFAIHPPYAFNTLSYWSHNSFTFMGGTLVLMIGAFRLRNPAPIGPLTAIGLGLASGILTAVQLYFATWVAGIALGLISHTLLNTRRLLPALVAGFTACMAALMSFFLSTLPVMHRYRELFWWIKGLILHQGVYRSGPQGVTSLSRILSNFSRLWSEGGALVLAATIAVVLLAVVCIVLQRKAKGGKAWWWAVMIGSTFQLGITLLLILKHPGQIYLLALAAILPVSVVWLSEAISSTTLRSRLSGAVGLTVVLIGFLVAANRSIQAPERMAEDIREVEEEVGQVLGAYSEESGRPRDSLVLLWGYGSPSRCFALRFGNIYVEGIFSAEIEEICPRDWIYNVWDGVAELPSGVRPLAEATGWDVLIMPQRYLGENTEGVDVAYQSERTGLVYLTRLGQSPLP